MLLSIGVNSDLSGRDGKGPKSSLPLWGNVINLRNRPVIEHRNTRRSGGNLPPQKMAWRLIVAATEVLTLVVNSFPITTFAKLTTLPLEGKVARTAGRKRCPRWAQFVYYDRGTRHRGTPLQSASQTASPQGEAFWGTAQHPDKSEFIIVSKYNNSV